MSKERSDYSIYKNTPPEVQKRILELRNKVTECYSNQIFWTGQTREVILELTTLAGELSPGEPYDVTNLKSNNNSHTEDNINSSNHQHIGSVNISN